MKKKETFAVVARVHTELWHLDDVAPVFITDNETKEQAEHTLEDLLLEYKLGEPTLPYAIKNDGEPDIFIIETTRPLPEGAQYARK